MHITQTPKNLIQSRKRREHVSVLEELKRWTVKILNGQVEGEFVVLIAKKQPNNNSKALLVS